MPDVTFSITERFIINPVLYMRAPLRYATDSPPSMMGKIWHVLEAELGARATAIFTSVFAAADALIHLGTGFYKLAYLELQKRYEIKPESWNDAEVKDHFEAVGFYTGMALVGSIICGIWPDSCKLLRRTPTPPSETNIIEQLPLDVRNLYEAYINNKLESPEKSAKEKLQEFWSNSNLSGKHWFVQVFNSQGCKEVRKSFAPIVYRDITLRQVNNHTWTKTNVSWKNEGELTTYNWGQINQISRGVFFHATSEEALESILKTKKIEVRHEKAFRGAFVSTKPELSFGKCVLVFRRNIERLSKLQHGFTINQDAYWAGFSQDIPVAESTLACILVNSHNYQEVESIKEKCEQWAGRKIEVISYEEAKSQIHKIGNGGPGIPFEWPDEGEEAGLAILNAMKPVLSLAQKADTQYQPQKQLLIH